VPGSGDDLDPILLITADELRTYLEMSESDLSTARAEYLIAGVSGLVLEEVDRPRGFEAITDTIVINGHGRVVELLPVLPVIDVVSVVEDPRGAATALEIDTAVEWSEEGILRRIDGYVFARRLRYYEVELEHGWPATPAAVKLIVSRVTARAVVNPEALATESAGGYVSGFAFDDTRIVTLATPDRRELLRYKAN
jgi:hypothetical protein